MTIQLDFIQNLVESVEGPRIPHPEDSIFDGTESTVRLIDGIKEAIARPQEISIKWDGDIALFFGKNSAGQFFCADKYMYPKGVMPTSPEAWVDHDHNNRRQGATRDDLYKKIKLIWAGLEQACSQCDGVFKGDLMAVGNEIHRVRGQYRFQGPTVEYRIPTNSPIGVLMNGAIGVVVVHQYNGAPWDGHSGLVSGGNVAILNSTAGNTFRLNEPTQLIKAADAAVATHGGAVDALLGGMTKVAKDTLKTYFNKKITRQTDQELADWLMANKPAQYNKLIASNYLADHESAYEGLKSIWNAVYFLKVDLVTQLESQVRGFGQYVDGKPAGEGFVFNTSYGLIKFVNRGVFGVAHFNKN
jgi:Family of unknown function (DUF6267)